MKNLMNKDLIEQELIWDFENKANPNFSIELAGATVLWQPATMPRAVVRGPQALVEQVGLQNNCLGTTSGNRLKLPLFSHAQLVVELYSPAIAQWTVVGSAALYLRGIDQKSLHLKVEGSGDIYAAGTVEEVEVTVIGSGEVDTGLLLQKRAKVRITGHGDVHITPSEHADLGAGSGDIKILSKPQTLTYA